MVLISLMRVVMFTRLDLVVLGAQLLTVKILDKKLHYKLLFYPDLYFGEAYTEGTLQVENGTISDLLEILVRNLRGR